jgi:UDP-GlcNAc:undecaprenyl-phosphate GlcNAc-1-phosphate transferase
LLVLIGFFDDIFQLKALSKLLLQGVASCVFLITHMHVITSSQHIGFIALCFALSLFWSLLMINACNLIDVMDGLLVVSALNMSFGYIFLAFFSCQPIMLWFLLALIGSSFAFLCRNLPPASMYLGDSGSLFLGGVFAWLPFFIDWASLGSSLCFVPIFMAAIPLLEVGMLVIIRKYKGIPFYQGSPHHFSHYLLKKGYSKQTILLFISMYSMGWICIAYACLALSTSVVLPVSFLLAGSWFYAIYC